MKKLIQHNLLTFIIALAFFLPFSIPGHSFALSEYGIRCADNKDCVKCRNRLSCMKCMNRCWNAYGYADTDIKSTTVLSKDELCQQRRAKWCNAQCWDPDDTKEQDYISTKPDCSSSRFHFPEGGIKFPNNRPLN